MARIMTSSSISRAAGVIPAAMIADTASAAASIDGNEARAVLTASGSWRRRTMTAVTRPNVPSAPTTTPVRSYPGRSRVLPPTHTSSPVPVTSWRPSTWLVVMPYFRQCGPPAFVETLPPMEDTIWLDGSGAKK